MTTYAAPAWLQAAQVEFGILKAGVQFNGPYNGTLQATDFVAERWVTSLVLPPRMRANAGAVEAFFNRMAGGVNWVSLWHFGSGSSSQPGAPRGTLRSSPTLTSAIARGDLALSLSGCTPGETLLAGDMISAVQLFQVADDAVANGGGVMAVNLINRVRTAVSGGTAVVWNKPTATFAMPAMGVRHVHVPGIMLGGQFDLVEVW